MCGRRGKAKLTKKINRSVSFSGGADGMVIAHDLKTLKPIYGMGANKKEANFITTTNDKLVVSGGDGHVLIYQF